MIEWLNANSGAMLVLWTAVYAICTCLLYLSARRANELTVQKAEEAQRPLVVVRFEHPGVAAHDLLHVKNIGQGIALKVHVAVSRFGAKDFASLAPNTERKIRLFSCSTFAAEHRGEPLEVQVRYYRAGREDPYDEPHCLDVEGQTPGEEELHYESTQAR